MMQDIAKTTTLPPLTEFYLQLQIETLKKGYIMEIYSRPKYLFADEESTSSVLFFNRISSLTIN